MSHQSNSIYATGHQAFHLGTPAADNPYDYGDPYSRKNAAEWDRGWEAAQRESQQFKNTDGHDFVTAEDGSGETD